MKYFWLVFRVLAVVVLAIGVTLIFFQEALIFHAQKTPADYKYELSAPFEERYFEAGGARIHSILFRSPENLGLILYFHGNAGNLEDWSDVAMELANATNRAVWILDYPGFGKSGGSISSENQLHEIAREFLSLGKKEFPTNEIVIFGRSIGSGLAVPLAAGEDIRAVVLESPFLSLQAMAKIHYPFVPEFLLRYRFRSDEKMSGIEAPILLLHGTDDEIVPFSQGQELAKLNPRTHFVAIEKFHHNDLGDSDDYWDKVVDFIRSLEVPHHR